MLSYQHLYHAGNLADVHKHAALAWVLSYLTRKDKPLSYLETHGGRGLYDLKAAEAVKTGEAAAGIGQVLHWFDGHPYGETIAACRAEHGPDTYPGSPWIAAHLLRETDDLHVAELHPKERAALEGNVPSIRVHPQDGFAMAHSLCPPTPRRGFMLIDPSYEVKAEYEAIPKHLTQLHRAWPVGVIALWFPILADNRHTPMCAQLTRQFPDALLHEVRFPAIREGHRLIGSGLFTINHPWGMEDALAELAARFERL